MLQIIRHCSVEEHHLMDGRLTLAEFNTHGVATFSLRLIGRTVTARVHSETVEVYLGTAHLLTMPRLIGEGKHQIDYRHVIWSLVRKPGAFAHYRYRDDLYPSLAFRQAYDALGRAIPARADREYVRVLHLAASTSEAEVEAALQLVAEQHLIPTFDTVRELGRDPAPPRLPPLTPAQFDFGVYDRLLAGGPRHA